LTKLMVTGVCETVEELFPRLPLIVDRTFLVDGFIFGAGGVFVVIKAIPEVVKNKAAAG